VDGACNSSGGHSCGICGIASHVSRPIVVAATFAGVLTSVEHLFHDLPSMLHIHLAILIMVFDFQNPQPQDEDFVHFVGIATTCQLWVKTHLQFLT